MLGYIFLLFVAAVLIVVVGLLVYNMYLNYKYRDHTEEVWRQYHTANNKSTSNITARGNHVYQDGVQLDDDDDDDGMRMLTVAAIIACLIILGLLLFL